MTETDRMLVHLQSFYSNTVFYTVPESVQKGVPLFYLPSNSTVPQINLQHGENGRTGVYGSVKYPRCTLKRTCTTCIMLPCMCMSYDV